MGFTVKQSRALRRNVDGRQIRTREANGRELSYLEGWYVVSEANRIFGFDGWSRETIDTRPVFTRENRGFFNAVYTAKVRITVRAGDKTVIREGHGSGEGRGSSPAEVHDIALKAAETDATKRAFATFGRPFGLELYRQSRIPASTTPLAPESKSPIIPPTRVGLHPDDTTPIPRPSRYHGYRQGPPIDPRALDKVASPKIAPPLPAPPSAARIDKSVLTIAEPKRRRDKLHLRFVASQPCLVCGRHPSDPHHLRFAQPRALGVKVSDEFTVPLCRGHHRQLHQAGDETIWWENLKLEPLRTARQLWEQTHAGETQVTDDRHPSATAATK